MDPQAPAPRAAGPEIEPPSVEMFALQGSITWSLRFDADALAQGALDCSYRRVYTGLEDRSTPWLCPDCGLQFRVDVEMSDADRDCYAQIGSPSGPQPVERLGWSDEAFWRGGALYSPTALQGPWTPADAPEPGAEAVSVGWADTISLEVGSVSLSTSGQLSALPAVGDPWHGLHPPERSACGWARADVPPYEGAYQMAIGAQIPDGRFLDACGEALRLHELSQRYVVLDISAADCPPCQDMAADAAGFEDAMQQLHREVEIVTLLSRSLSAPHEPASGALLDEWTDAFALSSPVLGDRGWGLAMSLSAFPETLSYPTWVVLSPSMQVLSIGQGYGGWGPMYDVIATHHE